MKLLLLLVLLSPVVLGQDDNITDPAPAPTEEPPLLVSSVLERPFLMEKNGGYEGFIADLVWNLEEILDIETEFRIAAGNKYGQDLGDGTWDGMIGDVMTGEVAMAAGPLTITAERDEVVEISKPFMNVGVGLLTKNDRMSQDEKFIIFKPFSGSVWAMIIFSFILVSICFFLLNCYHPKEHKSAFSRGKSSQTDAEAYSIPGSFWTVFSTFMWQGYEKTPRSYAGRVLLAFWFIFVVFTLMFYTASMVTLLMAKPPPPPPASDADSDIVKDLVISDLAFGFIKGGSTAKFFKDSDIESYEYISENAFELESMEEGISEVMQGDFVMIGESVMLDYHMATASRCDLARVGKLLNSIAYGIALPTGSSLTDDVNEAILSLQEDGTLMELTKRWFSAEESCPHTTIPLPTGERQTVKLGVDLHKFTGVLVLLIIGIVLAAVTAVAEVFYTKFKNRPRTTREELLTAEEGTALNETTATALNETAAEPKEAEPETEGSEEKKKEKEEDVGIELEPEDKEEKEDKPKEEEITPEAKA